MKKLKILFMLLICCIFTLSITKNSVKAIENRRSITLDDTWVSDSIDTSTEDVHFYQFTTPSSGIVNCTFQSYEYMGHIEVLSDDLANTYSYLICSGSETNPDSVSENIYLEKGTYVLKIYYGVSTGSKMSGDYNLKLSFTPANNNETEPNDTFETAMELNENQQIRGLISDCETDDYFRISLKQAQKIHVLYRFDSKFSWTLWDSDFLPVYESYEEKGTNDWSTTLDAGTYYIQVNREYYSGFYTLKWFTETPVSSVELNKSFLQLAKGKVYTFSTTIEPVDATNKSLKWTSSNSSVASISSSGKLATKQSGATTITATSQDGTKISTKCVVIVLPEKARISKATVSGRKVSLQLRKQKGVSGYQITYSTTKNFNNKTTYNTTSTSFRTKKLLKNKKYYLKARAYYIYNGEKYYGSWSDISTVKIPK